MQSPRIGLILVLKGVIFHYIVSLKPELAMSTPTYDPFGTEQHTKFKLELCQKGLKAKMDIASSGFKKTISG